MCQFIIKRIKQEVPAVNSTCDMQKERERNQELHGPGKMHPEPPFHDTRQECQEHRDKPPGGTGDVANKEPGEGKIQEEDLYDIEQVNTILPLCTAWTR
jgi:hypothetical protein